jgi:hypothetical protein
MRALNDSAKNRCATLTTDLRADELKRGDVVIHVGWAGLTLATVTALAEEGEDVAVSLRAQTGHRLTLSTSPGNRFSVVTPNRAVCGPLGPNDPERHMAPRAR